MLTANKSFSFEVLSLLILALLLASCDKSQVRETSDITTTFRGDYSRSGVFEGQEIAQPKEIKWRFQAGDRIFSTPVIANGTVYFGSVNNNFYALDINSGQEKWKKETEGAISASAAIDNGIVYIGSSDGFLYAMDEASGEEKWRFETARTPVPPEDRRLTDHGIMSSSLVVNGIIYFGCDGDYFYALDSTTGKKLWEFKTDGPVDSSAAIADGVVYFASLNALYALDANTGGKKWEIRTGTSTMSNTPTVMNGLIYLDDVESVHAFEIGSGIEKWSFKLDKRVDWMIALDQKKAYFGDRYGFYSVDADTGEKKWEFKPFKNGPVTPASVAGNTVYYADVRGDIVALDAENGTMKWKYQFQKDPLQSPPPTSLTIADGVIYFGTMDGYLYAIEGGSSA